MRQQEYLRQQQSCDRADDMRLPRDSGHEIDHQIEDQRDGDAAEPRDGTVRQENQNVRGHQTVQPSGQSHRKADPGDRVFENTAADDRAEQDQRKVRMSKESFQRTEVVQREHIHSDMPGLYVGEAHSQEPPPLSFLYPVTVITAAPDGSFEMIIPGYYIEKCCAAHCQRDKPYGYSLAEQVSVVSGLIHVNTPFIFTFYNTLHQRILI